MRNRLASSVGILVLSGAALALGAALPTDAEGVEKVVLCHIPPGNPENPQTIEVGAPAVPAHMAHGDAIGPCGATQPTVTGGVFEFATAEPVAGALVSLTFLATGFSDSTVADENGLFAFVGLPVDGAFVLEATDPGLTAIGSAQGSIDAGNLETSVLVIIDQPGPGSLSGTISSFAGLPAGNALVTYLFPETARTGSVATGPDGHYAFTGLQTDGTVIVVAFDPASAASASSSTIVLPSFPNPTLNLTLPAPPVVQPELVNGDFNSGLDGWDSFGPTIIVPREEIFGSQALTAPAVREACPVIQSAVISSAGSNNGLGQLSQSFVVAPGYGTLAGRVKFLSNEWPVYYGTQYNDTFLVRLTTPSGARILASGNVNSSSWSGGILGFNGQAPEVNFTVDISGFVGKTLNLHFEVRDVADLLFDSGLAITDVRVIRTEQYVQDGGGLLTGSGSITGQFGQGVRLKFKNQNVLGTTLIVRDNTPFGGTKQVILLPQMSVTFEYARFGEEPMFWDWSVDTVSDAFVVTYEIESTWVPGMPPNPCY